MIGRLGRFAMPRRFDGCPPAWMLTRRMSGENPDGWLEKHLAECTRCAEECAALRAIVAQAQGLSAPAEMSAATRSAILARVLAARPESRPRQALLAVLLGAAGTAVFILAALLSARGLRHPPQESRPEVPAQAEAKPEGKGDGEPPHAAVATTTHRPSRAAIRAIGAARFRRVQGRPDDVVRLDDGAIVLEVAPLLPGERFRVRTDDAEVEVRGTHFQVSASHGKLTAVSVSSGRVEVRSAGGGHVVLEAHDEWVRGIGIDQPRRSSATAVTGTTASARDDARVAKSAARAPAGSPPRPAQAPLASFERAWSLLRQGDVRQAAEVFAEVERSAGDRDIAEDALYWRSVATAKTGERAEAKSLFERFLRRFPASPRAGEAAAALGWLYAEGGQADEARRAFERAASDPSAAVRDSAGEGLRRLAAP